MKQTKICHITSAHQWNDVRIFHKECVSLAKGGFEVVLLSLRAQSQSSGGIEIVGLGMENLPRLKRFFDAPFRLLRKALEINADIYHLHDPELLLIATKLKRKGKTVVYDAHEDLPRQIMSKPYLPGFLRTLLSKLTELIETRVVRKLDGVITATPFIRDRFLNIHSNTTDINNFPLAEEIDFAGVVSVKQDKVCYIGGITRIRGIEEMLKAIQKTKVVLDLAGEAEPDSVAILQQYATTDKVNRLGFISRSRSLEVKEQAIAGLVIFHPVPNHINAQPNKIFEYMASGIPVIGSDFSLWKEIIEGNNCGICVNPFDVESIASAINYLHANPVIARQMGENGKQAVRNRYNWGIEEKKLIAFYQNLTL